MSRLDRGPLFSGYYITDPAKPGVIYGASWLNPFDCGRFVKDGVTYAVTLFIFYKGDFPDCKGRLAESFDVDPSTADRLAAVPIIGMLLMGMDISPLLSTLTPTQQYLVGMDIVEGFSGPEIIDRRIAILTPEFLGFTFDDVLADHPYIWQPTIGEDGKEIPNVWKCSLEAL